MNTVGQVILVEAIEGSKEDSLEFRTTIGVIKGTVPLGRCHAALRVVLPGLKGKRYSEVAHPTDSLFAILFRDEGFKSCLPRLLASLFWG